MKHLKSHRERNRMRGNGKKASKSKSHHRHCHCLTSKDTVNFHTCCQSGRRCPSRKDAPFSTAFPVAQEPSIITGSRLIGHQGLFNHEVKSIDIERLLSEQRKLEKSAQEVQVSNCAVSHPSSTSHITSPFCTDDCSVSETEAAVKLEGKADTATKAHDDFHEKEKNNSQELDLTPEQRPQHTLPEHSSGSSNSTFLSKHIPLKVAAIKSRKTKPVTVKGPEISSLEHMPNDQESSGLHTQAHSLSPSPVKPSSSSNADNFDVHLRRQNTDCVSRAVSALSAGLCSHLEFPFLERRSLVAEGRMVLLKALQESHGPQLKGNLLQVQRCLSFGTNPKKETRHLEEPFVHQDELVPTDPFITTIFESQPDFDNQEKTPFEITRSRHFNWGSSPQVLDTPKQTSPAETSVNILNNISRPTCSPQFCMYFEPSGVTDSEHLFTPPPTSLWETSQHWKEGFTRPRSNETLMFGSSESSLMKQTRDNRERSSGSHYTEGPFFSYQPQLQDRHTAGPLYCPVEQGLFESEKCSFAPFLSDKIHHPQQHSHIQPFSQFSSPLICLPGRSQLTDIYKYPPSHMLERDSAPSLSLFPSLEPWSFPPMRLY